jgi:hypothetical protein
MCGSRLSRSASDALSEPAFSLKQTSRSSRPLWILSPSVWMAAAALWPAIGSRRKIKAAPTSSFTPPGMPWIVV